jgi:hypothetical protein
MPVEIEVAMPDAEILLVIVSVEAGKLAEVMGERVLRLHVREPFGYEGDAAEREARLCVNQEPRRDGFSQGAVIPSRESKVPERKGTPSSGRPGLHPDRFSPFRTGMNSQGKAREDPGDILMEELMDGNPEGMSVVRRRLLHVVAEGRDGKFSAGVHFVGPDDMILDPEFGWGVSLRDVLPVFSPTGFAHTGTSSDANPDDHHEGNALPECGIHYM